MKNIYHGILLDLEFAEEKFVEKNFHIFAKRKSKINPWVLYGVEVDASQKDEIVQKIQDNMKSDKPYYAHLYNDRELMVIFKDKIFSVTPHISTWDEIISYGKKLNIPSEQLDFWPNRFQDERHYFSPEDFI